MYTKLSASRAYVYAVARAADAGKVSREDCAGAILYVSDRCVEVAMDAQQCFGGNGYINGELRVSSARTGRADWVFLPQTTRSAACSAIRACTLSARARRRSAVRLLGVCSTRRLQRARTTSDERWGEACM